MREITSAVLNFKKPAVYFFKKFGRTFARRLGLNTYYVCTASSSSTENFVKYMTAAVISLIKPS